MRKSTKLLIALALAACSTPDADHTSVTTRVSGDFLLVQIGQESIGDRVVAPPRCDERPFFSRYEFRDSTWISVDSLLSPCVGAAARIAQAITASGHFVTRGDSLDFFVRESRIGQNGLVGRGVIRGDTLVLWNSDLDGGDYTYMRRP